MKPRITLAITGGVVGLVVGMCAALVAAGATLGIVWLFVFGDNPWPAWSNVLVAVIAGVVALACVIGGAWIGYHRGARIELSGGTERAALRQVVVAAGIAALLTGALAGFFYRSQRANQRERMRQQSFASWAGQRQRIRSAEAVLRPDDSGWEVTATTSGAGGGSYALHLEVERSEGVLMAREAEVNLSAGENTPSILLSRDELISAYAGKVFRAGATNLAIEETVTVRVSLRPQLEAEKMREWEVNGPTVQQLAETRELPLKINFTIGSDGRARFED